MTSSCITLSTLRLWFFMDETTIAFIHPKSASALYKRLPTKFEYFLKCLKIWFIYYKKAMFWNIRMYRLWTNKWFSKTKSRPLYQRNENCVREPTQRIFHVVLYKNTIWRSHGTKIWRNVYNGIEWLLLLAVGLSLIYAFSSSKNDSTAFVNFWF